MFTGLVETTGKIVSLETRGDDCALCVQVSAITDPQIGESITVNGCCLTLAARDENKLCFNVLAETLRRTNLGRWREQPLVNIERALAANGRFGGHIVQGHVDCTAGIRAFEKVSTDHRLEVELPREFHRYVVFKGSIAINGISLTVAEVRGQSFVAWIIPHTFAQTNLREARAGDLVNLEFDVLAKYVERLLPPLP